MEFINGFYAGTITTEKSNPASTYSFDNTFPTGSNVIVIPMLQTRNGKQNPNLRIWDVSATGFTYQMSELYVGNVKCEPADGSADVTYKSMKSVQSDGSTPPPHNPETIAFIAFVC